MNLIRPTWSRLPGGAKRATQHPVLIGANRATSQIHRQHKRSADD